MGSSSLAIRKRATIQGGTLNIHISALELPDASLSTGLTAQPRKWTILTVKAGIRGNFNKFTASGNINKNSPYKVQVIKSNDKRTIEVEITKK